MSNGVLSSVDELPNLVALPDSVAPSLVDSTVSNPVRFKRGSARRVPRFHSSTSLRGERFEESSYSNSNIRYDESSRSRSRATNNSRMTELASGLYIAPNRFNDGDSLLTTVSYLNNSEDQVDSSHNQLHQQSRPFESYGPGLRQAMTPRNTLNPESRFYHVRLDVGMAKLRLRPTDSFQVVVRTIERANKQKEKEIAGPWISPSNPEFQQMFRMQDIPENKQAKDIRKETLKKQVGKVKRKPHGFGFKCWSPQKLKKAVSKMSLCDTKNVPVWYEVSSINNIEPKLFEYLLQDHDYIKVYYRKRSSPTQVVTDDDLQPILDKKRNQYARSMGIFTDYEKHFLQVHSHDRYIDLPVVPECRKGNLGTDGEYLEISLRMTVAKKSNHAIPRNDSYLQYDDFNRNDFIGPERRPYSLDLQYTQSFEHCGNTRWKDGIILEEDAEEGAPGRIYKQKPMPLPPGWERESRKVEVYINHNDATVQLRHPLDDTSASFASIDQ